ncbi:DUF3634 family protein [Luteolibacter flavescens]|uniref:DUF3634 family protein n=1 Tax=Luteolibacter flavescens TaxID=1859460 RepID=A0ABT3FLY3_9BACT|nr:DUF3634 family protein [Luteolibacter flavescens]MCW1884581.1 DUF3634 family protein [Luteolibacter flavescens]
MLWLLKLTSPLVLVIRAGKVGLAKGRLSGGIIREIQSIVSDEGIASGTIHADGSGRYHFSDSIPGELHQQLRNVLVSS